ncbi:MAG: phosphatidylglycerol lysyltransferase domain-containing protein [Candidatus Dormibacteraceae bacterium]
MSLAASPPCRIAAASFGAYGRNPSVQRFMSASGRSWIAYRPCGRRLIALGGASGAEEELAGLREGFLRWAAPRPVVWYGAGEPLPGLSALPIGEEAIIQTDRFSLEGRPMANLRHSVAAAGRAGLEVWEGAGRSLPEALGAELAAIDREWRRRRRLRLGFSVSTFEEAAADSRPWSVVRSVGRVEAFVSWLPSPDGSGWVLDLMRRRPDAAPGAVELALVRGIVRATSQGRTWVSLGLARPADHVDGGRLARAFNPVSLRAFKKKFRPDWEKRYLLLPGGASPIPALLAVAWLHAEPTLPRLAPQLPRLAPHLRLGGAAAATATAAVLILGMSGIAPPGAARPSTPRHGLVTTVRTSTSGRPSALADLTDLRAPAHPQPDADRANLQSGA